MKVKYKALLNDYKFLILPIYEFKLWVVYFLIELF